MSAQLKNTTISDGFINNPDRIYFKEYFDDLPQQLLEFSLVQASGTAKEFSFVQPAGTFLKEAYVLCKTSPAFGSASNIGITVGTASNVTPGSGDIIIGNGQNNILASATAQIVNSIVKVFPATELNAGSDKVIYTSAARTLYAKVSNSVNTNDSGLGLYNFIVIYGTLNRPQMLGNKIYEFSGTGTPSVDYSTNDDYSGMVLTTSAAANDTVILSSGTLNDNPVSSGLFNTNADIEFETSVCVPNLQLSSSVPTISVIAGLKQTTAISLATDTHQAYFMFGAEDPLVGGSDTLTSKTTWHFVYKNSTGLYVTNLGLNVNVDTPYNLKIKIDRFRKIKAFINGQQYGLTQTISSSPFNTQETSAHQQSNALTTNQPLYPVIALQTTGTNATSVYVNYVNVSRSTRKST